MQMFNIQSYVENGISKEKNFLKIEIWYSKEYKFKVHSSSFYKVNIVPVP